MNLFKLTFLLVFFKVRKKLCLVCTILCLTFSLAKIRSNLESHRLATKCSLSKISYHQTMDGFLYFCARFSHLPEKSPMMKNGLWVAILKGIWETQAHCFVSDSRGVQCRSMHLGELLLGRWPFATCVLRSCPWFSIEMEDQTCRQVGFIQDLLLISSTDLSAHL